MKHKRIWIRRAIQVFFFVLIALTTVNFALAETGFQIPFLSTGSTHALCPLGGLSTIYQFALTGTFVKKIHESSFILMIIIFITALGFGPLFCGWVCPLGSLQEWFGQIGRKILKNKYNNLIPGKIDKYLRYARYGVLAWLLYMVAITGQITVFEQVDPYYALFNFWSSEIALGGIIILIFTLLASLFIERPWCKYACPYGAVLGITNLFSLFKIRRDPEICISCKACDKACPMNIKVSQTAAVRNHQCISCLKCTPEENCPVKNASYVAFRWSKPILTKGQEIQSRGGN